MKDSFKTFPNLPIFPLPWEDYTQLTEVVTQYECFIRDVLQWKNNSQTELQERLKQQITTTKWGEARALLINEILGEQQ